MRQRSLVVPSQTLWQWLIMAVTLEMVSHLTYSCSAACAASETARCQNISRKTTSFSYPSSSGYSGSGSGNDSAMTSSASGNDGPHQRASGSSHFGSRGHLLSVNTNTAPDETENANDRNGMHWTTHLPQLKTLERVKDFDQEQFRQYLNHTVTIMLTVQIGKGKTSSCGSDTSVFKEVVGKWINVFEGAQNLLVVLQSCFPYKFVSIFNCSASGHNFSDDSDLAEINLGPVDSLARVSESEELKNRTSAFNRQRMKAVRTWANLLEKHFFDVQNMSKDVAALGIAQPSLQCPLFEIERKLLAAHLIEVSSAAIFLLGLYSDLHDFGVLLNELRSWKRPGETSHTAHEGRAPRSYPECILLPKLTISSLGGATAISNICEDERLCRDMRRTLTFFGRLPFILPAKKMYIEHSVALVCQNLSGLENFDSGPLLTGDNTTCLSTGRSVCVHQLTLNCTEKFGETLWVRTNRSTSSFSYEVFYRDYIRRIIGSSFIDENWPENADRPWCRLACTPGIHRPNWERLIRKIGFYMTDAIVLSLVFFACYLLLFNERNFYRMTRNPRRTYLYLNFWEVVRHFFFHIGLYGTDGNYCNSDGSRVLYVDEVTAGCKLEASFAIAMDVAYVITLLWVTCVWTRTMFKLQKTYRVEEDTFWQGLTAYELLEAGVGLFTAVVFLVIFALPFFSQNLFHFKIEGSSALHLCISVDYWNSSYLYGTNLGLRVALGFGFFLISRTFKKLKVLRSTVRAMYRAAGKRDDHMAALKKWRRRHRLFGIVLLVRALLVAVHLGDVIIRGNRHSFKLSLESYLACLRSLRCPEDCAFFEVPNEMSLTVFGILMVSFGTNCLIFLWVFFDEIEWNALSKFRPKFKI